MMRPSLAKPDRGPVAWSPEAHHRSTLTGVRRSRDPVVIALEILAVLLLIGAAGSVFGGLVGATGDVGSSWSDPGPRNDVRIAAGCAAAAVACLLGAWVVHRWNQR
jgi:hypothetical protein